MAPSNAAASSLPAGDVTITPRPGANLFESGSNANDRVPGWGILSGFKYELYEVSSETNVGRALLKSDDVIPPAVKSYDGAEVTIEGFVLPLRIRRQRVTEFLLLRDQGTCCFGPQAQINHFIRVNYPAGFRHEGATPWTVRGTLHVGERYVQGYLTGIYFLDAKSVDEPASRVGQ